MDTPHLAEAVPLVQRLFAAARAKSADLATQLHPAWVQMAWRRIGLPVVPPQDGRGRVQRSRAFAELYGMRWPSLVSFLHAAHRIALLPRPEMLRVLAAVALHAERERVRRSIGRAVRHALIERIGEPAWRGLLEAPERRTASVAAFGLDELELERLAAAGYAALRVQGAWQCRQSLAWVRLALPPNTDEAPASPSAAPDPAPVVDRLPTYFPEHAWLFGSPMDRALSA